MVVPGQENGQKAWYPDKFTWKRDRVPRHGYWTSSDGRQGGMVPRQVPTDRRRGIGTWTSSHEQKARYGTRTSSHGKLAWHLDKILWSEEIIPRQVPMNRRRGTVPGQIPMDRRQVPRHVPTDRRRGSVPGQVSMYRRRRTWTQWTGSHGQETWCLDMFPQTGNVTPDRFPWTGYVVPGKVPRDRRKGTYLRTSSHGKRQGI